MESDFGGFTFIYKHAESSDLDLALDYYPPSIQSASESYGSTRGATSVSPTHLGVPCLVYFHGGGMTAGDRKSWFPSWLHQRITSSGIAFISADYRLIPPCTGHDVLCDVKDLFTFLSTSLNTKLLSLEPNHNHPSNRNVFKIDPERIGVAGSSAGGLCAYLAAAHAFPRPKVVLSMYGMGGDFLTPHYLLPKTRPFFRGREILSPSTFSDFLYPRSSDLPQLSGSSLEYYGEGESEVYPRGYPKNLRMQLTRLYLQLGVLLDYWTGERGSQYQDGKGEEDAPRGAGEPGARKTGDEERSLSARLRVALTSDITSPNEERAHVRSLIPSSSLSLFPQILVDEHWPATFLVHGELDTAVPVGESRALYDAINKLRTNSTGEAGSDTMIIDVREDVKLKVIPGEEHSFDYQPGAEERFGEGGLYDEIVGFLRKVLEP